MTGSFDFTEEQKRYLEGFASGVEARRGAHALAPMLGTHGNGAAAPSGPESIHHAAQARVLADGKRLTAEERAKRDKNPFDLWDEIAANAKTGRFPKGTDVFLHKFHGLFYVAPAQDSFMCRLRMPGGILNAHQLRGVADIAQRFGGRYADVTTRANLQIREIAVGAAPAVLMAIQELGLTSRGAGADNIRNITGSPTAGIDPQELIDTRELSRALHHYILNHREMYGLPRKFNIAFDGGGQVSVLEDTNDIAFAACRLTDAKVAAPGVYFRLGLGGITGHGDFAKDTGVVVAPEECVAVAAAVVRVFIEHGDRSDRKRARLKYLLDAWGIERFMAETEKRLPFPWRRAPAAAFEPRPPILKHGHIGIHRQSEDGLSYIGVALPVGRLSVAQMQALADIADEHGSGTIRLTVWQNLLISDIPEAALGAAKQHLEAAGLTWSASSIRSALVACTGNTGCKFSATNTKGQALALADHLEARVALDQPVNIHLTGCPNSCAQHAVADIGLLGVKVAEGEDLVEGYHIFVGGAAGAEQRIARELWPSVPFALVLGRIEGMLRAYVEHRSQPGESFQAFVARHDLAALRRLFEAAAASPGAEAA
ncbi:MAG: NirA family protein [Proteobacteria bacterium]|nr:NirA family protein [Pseudomonadota bacterium]MBI3500143.1 NirA family protein [Pseudomonadota bacterium]